MGGTQATLLYLLEAPGPRAIASGFVSRDNPDETAKNLLLLNREAGIERGKTVVWNIVPWYIGTGQKIRAASGRDTAAGAENLERLLNLLPRLRYVVFLGAHAAKAGPLIARLRPGLETFRVPHPSPMFVNRAPGNRGRILSVLKRVGQTAAVRPRRRWSRRPRSGFAEMITALVVRGCCVMRNALYLTNDSVFPAQETAEVL